MGWPTSLKCLAVAGAAAANARQMMSCTVSSKDEPRPLLLRSYPARANSAVELQKLQFMTMSVRLQVYVLVFIGFCWGDTP